MADLLESLAKQIKGFITAIKETHKKNIHAKAYLAAIKFAEQYFQSWRRR
jgi:hypothetical protein